MLNRATVFGIGCLFSMLAPYPASAQGFPLQQIGIAPDGKPICDGPAGPGACAAIQAWMAQQQQYAAAQQYAAQQYAIQQQQAFHREQSFRDQANQQALVIQDQQRRAMEARNLASSSGAAPQQNQLRDSRQGSGGEHPDRDRPQIWYDRVDDNHVIVSPGEGQPSDLQGENTAHPSLNFDQPEAENSEPVDIGDHSDDPEHDAHDRGGDQGEHGGDDGGHGGDGGDEGGPDAA